MGTITSAESEIERWLGVEEIAKHLGVSKETIYRRLEDGSIPSHRIGKLWRFKASEIDVWMKRGGAEAETPATIKEN